MDGERWVLAYERDGAAAHPRTTVPTGAPLSSGRRLIVGREGDLPLGVEVYDRGVSRTAAIISAVANGWQVEIRNGNGAVLHPWGQAPTLARSHHALSWPRVGIRILGGADPGRGDTVQHWVLLESESISVTGAGAQPAVRPTTSTFRRRPPNPLSPGQLEALTVVFADHLCWPPAQPAEPLLLRTAARRLGISESGVQQRLGKALEKALALGLPRPVGLTDPQYLYVLVGAGYVPIPPPPYRRPLVWPPA